MSNLSGELQLLARDLQTDWTLLLSQDSWVVQAAERYIRWGWCVGAIAVMVSMIVVDI